MRLPMQGEEVDLAQTQQMVDAFLAAGFNYFDTAHGYLDGRSETALKACLTSRYPREDYVLTNKLTANFFKTEADIRPFFESQLAACGVDDFDFYLMHAQSMKNFEHFKACRAYETAFALKAEGKNPLTIDCKEPTASYIDFIKSENRYSRLAQAFPERAAELFAKAEKSAKAKFEHLKKMEELYN